MAETLGSLIDKLTIANIRLWHLEDMRRDKTLTDKKRLKAADGVSVVNSQRNNLIDEIDQYVSDIFGTELTNPKVKLYDD